MEEDGGGWRADHGGPRRTGWWRIWPAMETMVVEDAQCSSELAWPFDSDLNDALA